MNAKRIVVASGCDVVRGVITVLSLGRTPLSFACLVVVSVRSKISGDHDRNAVPPIQWHGPSLALSRWRLEWSSEEPIAF